MAAYGLLVVGARDRLRQVLGHLTGYEVTMVETGGAALASFCALGKKNGFEQFSVLVDVDVPDLAWATVVESFYATSVVPPIAVVDSCCDVSRAILAISSGAREYLQSPSSTVELGNLLDSLTRSTPTQRQWDDAFFRDEVFDRPHRDQLMALFEYRLQGLLEQQIAGIRAQSQGKSNSEKCFLELAADQISDGRFVLKDLLLTLENYFPNGLSSLRKPDLWIVEDDRSVSDTLTYLFNATFQVTVAQSISEGRAQLRGQLFPDIVILDLQLPDGRGDELYSEIRSAYPRAVVVAFSGIEDVSLTVKMMKSGIFDFISKPCAPEFLADRLRRAWRRKTWPFFEGKMDLTALNFWQRVCFLDFLIRHKRIKKENVYTTDVLGVFPEIPFVFGNGSGKMGGWKI